MLASLGAKTSEFLRSLPRAWRLLGSEQRVAAVGCILLIVSTFGPFTWVEAAEVVTALAVLLLLKKRAEGSVFHLPFGDGSAIAAAGAWCALLVLIRFFDRSPGQSLLALACTALVFGAGMRERAKRPMDDLPEETIRVPGGRAAERIRRDADEAATERVPGTRTASEIYEEVTWRIPGDRDTTDRLAGEADPTRRIPPDREATDRIADDAAPTERVPEEPDRGSSSGSRRP
jgi:hypothetical protein